MEGQFKIRFLPWEFELLEPIQKGIEPKVHRPHVAGGHFGFKDGNGLGSFFNRHSCSSSRRNADDHIAPLFDRCDDLLEYLQSRAGSSVLWIPRMDVNDGCSGFG